ncbi:MAG TPA: PQQ-dependent sugar dehydrogenase [Acidimicrobiales bacterium]|nr:PQQ-dependent sugar dehydrogenase [Acidimicrobiales bacterium]
MARFVVALVAVVVVAGCADERPIRPSDISLADGFRIEALVEELNAPTMVAFDDQGRMLIAESGYHGGGESRVSRLEPDGSLTVLAGGDAFGDEVPVTSVGFHEGTVYVAHAGTLSAVEPGGRLRTVVGGLPGQGDHQANQMVFRDGFIYFSVGTVTNSGVVGPDNAVFGWLGVEARRQLHEVPCADVVLTDAVFDSENPLGNDPEREQTTAYSPYGTVRPAGSVVPGNPKCNGSVLRVRPDGSGLEVVAWGLRNPYGLELGPDGGLYATMHGFDARGSRPIEDAWDCVYRIEQGAWYGWPDFACDVPVTDARFEPKNKPQPGFLIANHPTETPPTPIAKFNPHAATNGFAFSPGEPWGSPTTAYVALFGDFTPATGVVDRPQGVKVVKLDTVTGETTTFMENKTEGQASRHSGGGLEHPSDVTFGPDGAMYVTDWSIARVSERGLVLEPSTGVVWKVVPGKPEGAFPGGISLLFAIAGTLALAAATFVAAVGRQRTRRPVAGLVAGALAGLVMGGFTMVVGAPALDLPWHAPPRVLATLVMGRSAVENILDFDLLPTAVGAVVLLAVTALGGLAFAFLLRASSRLRVLVAGVLFGLTVWALLQYFGFPLVQPLVTEKGFPPQWYAASFAVYGLVLGALVAAGGERETGGDGGGGGAPSPAPAPAPSAGDRTVRDAERERMEEWRRRRAGG